MARVADRDEREIGRQVLLAQFACRLGPGTSWSTHATLCIDVTTGMGRRTALDASKKRRFKVLIWEVLEVRLAETIYSE